jgi:fatty acid desaturase
MLPNKNSDGQDLSRQAYDIEIAAQRQFRRMARLIRGFFLFLVTVAVAVFYTSGVWQDGMLLVLFATLALMTVQMMKVLYALMLAVGANRSYIHYLEDTRGTTQQGPRAAEED